jgi:outer membrane protein, heavy metal efflux system
VNRKSYWSLSLKYVRSWASLTILPICLCAQTPPAPAEGSLTLDQAVREALDKNLGLMAERLNVPVARAREITAALRPNPQLTLDGEYLDWLRRGYGPNDSGGPPEFQSRIDYTFEGKGKRAGRIAVAQLTRNVAELRLLDTIRLLTLQVQSGFVDLLAAKASLQLARENLAVFSAILDVNNAKVRAGELAGVELIRTRVAQQQVQNAVQQSDLRVRTASNTLQGLLGRTTPVPNFDVTGSLRSDTVVMILDELRTQSLVKRPDLLAQRKDTDRAKADTRLQLANKRVDYSLGTSYHYQFGYADSHTFGLFLQVPLPVYNRNQGEIVRSEREFEQAQLRGRSLEAGILTEVENAWQQYTTAKRLLDRIGTTMLDEARQVREITDYSYRRGEATFLEFLDAQRAFIDATQSYNDARADYTRSLYLIDAVTGRSVNP